MTKSCYEKNIIIIIVNDYNKVNEVSLKYKRAVYLILDLI